MFRDDDRLSTKMAQVANLWRSGRAELDEAIILVSMGDSTGKLASRIRKALQGRASFDEAIWEQQAKERKALNEV
jgi:hypothetical protein